MLFTVEIDEEWFDVLDSLIETTRYSSKATPEEELEVIIFFQFKLQRLKMTSHCLDLCCRKETEVVMFPYDPQPQELADYWEGYEDSPESSCQGSEIEEHLIPRCFSCGADAEEWDTACFECGGPVG
jgi:hypothetical protein